MPRTRLATLALYDIADDRTRRRVSECCLDFGLVRFQYSAFHGWLTRNRREELALRLSELVADEGGRITIVPICQSDLADRIDIAVAAPEHEPEELVLTLYRGDDDVDHDPHG